MTRHSIVIFLSSVLAVGGCKGETVVKPDPQTQADLDNCKRSLDEKDKLIKAEEEENASLMRSKGSANEIVVLLEGTALTVKPPAPGTALPMDEKAAGAASKEFVNVVAKSRGAIQKCYEQLLKKRTELQAHSVTLTVSASFTAAGAYRDSAFAPSLGDPFDTCIKTVASKWVLPTNSPAMTFKAQVSLTPSGASRNALRERRHRCRTRCRITSPIPRRRPARSMSRAATPAMTRSMSRPSCRRASGCGSASRSSR